MFLAAILAVAAIPADVPAELLTVAEASDYKATATHAQVMHLLQEIDERSEIMHLTDFGTTFEGKKMPLAIIANPPVTTPAEAKASGKPVIFAFGAIHAGEICGKEAILRLAREIALDPDHELLDDVVLLLAPIFNADGNDKMDPRNRYYQVGPEEGMGTRHNGQDLDLNRDWIKLESPENQAMVRLYTEWDPNLIIDTHVTNGSKHRYTVTYSAPANPSGFNPSIAFVRDDLLPTVTERMLEKTGYDSFFYGDFNRDHTTWSTYSAGARYGCPYRGLRGQMAILSEAYAYASYKDRVLVSYHFLTEIFTYMAENAETALELHQRARDEVTAAGADPQPDDTVGIRHKIAAETRPRTLKGYKLAEDENGRMRPGDEPAEYTVTFNGRFEPTKSVRRPHAYIIEPGHENVVEKLRQHGVVVSEFSGRATVETYTITEREQANRLYQGHKAITVEADAHRQTKRFPAGSILVTTAQPLGSLIVYMLEPESEDGLVTWNFLDEWTEVGSEFPIHRVALPDDLR